MGTQVKEIKPGGVCNFNFCNILGDRFQENLGILNTSQKAQSQTAIRINLPELNSLETKYPYLRPTFSQTNGIQ